MTFKSSRQRKKVMATLNENKSSTSKFHSNIKKNREYKKPLKTESIKQKDINRFVDGNTEGTYLGDGIYEINKKLYYKYSVSSNSYQIEQFQKKEKLTDKQLQNKINEINTKTKYVKKGKAEADVDFFHFGSSDFSTTEYVPIEKRKEYEKTASDNKGLYRVFQR